MSLLGSVSHGNVMELTSGILKVEQIKNELDTLVSLFKDCDVDLVKVAYGFGCESDMDVQYVDMEIPTKDLKDFIERSVAKGIYKFGYNDLHVKSEQEDVEFLLCHESDIHLYTDSNESFNWILNKWLISGYHCHHKPNDGAWQDSM